MKKLSIWMLLQLLAVFSFAQVSLRGKVLGSGEDLAGASVLLTQNLYGVSTDGDGNFEFKNLKKGNYTLKVSFIGFETQELQVKLESDKQIKVELQPDVVMTDEILVSATRAGNKTPVAYSTVTSEDLANRNIVITSYSIHYTKLYDASDVETKDGVS